jgi:hypothetical protein
MSVGSPPLPLATTTGHNRSIFRSLSTLNLSISRFLLTIKHTSGVYPGILLAVAVDRYSRGGWEWRGWRWRGREGRGG